MPIPKEILSVERPKNTIVYAYGKNKELFQNNLYTWFNDIIPFFVRTQVLNVK